MDGIVVKESAIVRPSQNTPNHTLWLSTLDHLVPRIHVPTVYFYRPNGSPDFFHADPLRRALADVLVPFYPVAGRLVPDGSGRLELLCNGEGVMYVQAESSAAVEDCGDFTPGPRFRHLVPAVDNSGDVSDHPLLLVQVTRFRCGGVCLGVGLHHAVADGHSAINFINTWSDVARGLSVGVRPFLDRTLLRARTPPAPAFHHVEYDPPPCMLPRLPHTQQPKDPATARFYVGADMINSLRARNGDGRRYTTYETLAAHIWRCACAARGLAPEQPTKLYIATDGRSRLSPPLPPGFLGNVLFTATVVAAAGEVAGGSPAGTLGRIRGAIERMEDGYLRSALDYLEEQEDLGRLVRGSRTFACPNLNVVNWVRMPVHEADFGWGRPVFMGPGCVAFEGMAYVVRSAGGDGGLDVFICLRADHMQRFRKELYALSLSAAGSP